MEFVVIKFCEIVVLVINFLVLNFILNLINYYIVFNDNIFLDVVFVY